MSVRKEVVERYIDGFRRVDHTQILSCLTDDVVWALLGYTTVTAKESFDKEIRAHRRSIRSKRAARVRGRPA